MHYITFTLHYITFTLHYITLHTYIQTHIHTYMHACIHTYIYIYIYTHTCFYIYKHLYDVHFCFNQILKYVVVFLRLTIFREGSRQDVIQSGNKELLTDHLVRSGAWLCQGWRGVKLAQWIRHRFEPASCQVGAGMVWCNFHWELHTWKTCNRSSPRPSRYLPLLAFAIDPKRIAWSDKRQWLFRKHRQTAYTVAESQAIFFPVLWNCSTTTWASQAV